MSVNEKVYPFDSEMAQTEDLAAKSKKKMDQQGAAGVVEDQPVEQQQQQLRAQQEVIQKEDQDVGRRGQYDELIQSNILPKERDQNNNDYENDKDECKMSIL